MRQRGSYVGSPFFATAALALAAVLPAATGHAAEFAAVGDVPIDAVYRCASDHRQDGEAVGW